MTDFFEINRLAIVDILEAWGINPDNVAQFGVTRDGYFEFQRDSFGHKILVDGGGAPQLEWREWPKGFPWEKLLAHVAVVVNGEIPR